MSIARHACAVCQGGGSRCERARATGPDGQRKWQAIQGVPRSVYSTAKQYWAHGFGNEQQPGGRLSAGVRRPAAARLRPRAHGAPCRPRRTSSLFSSDLSLAPSLSSFSSCLRRSRSNAYLASDTLSIWAASSLILAVSGFWRVEASRPSLMILLAASSVIASPAERSNWSSLSSELPAARWARVAWAWAADLSAATAMWSEVNHMMRDTMILTTLSISSWPIDSGGLVLEQ